MKYMGTIIGHSHIFAQPLSRIFLYYLPSECSNSTTTLFSYHKLTVRLTARAGYPLFKRCTEHFIFKNGLSRPMVTRFRSE